MSIVPIVFSYFYYFKCIVRNKVVSELENYVDKCFIEVLCLTETLTSMHHQRYAATRKRSLIEIDNYLWAIK